MKPDYEQAWYNRGVALMALSHPAEAVSAYRESLRLDSSNTDGWVNLGFALLNLRRVPEALQAYETALSQGGTIRLRSMKRPWPARHSGTHAGLSSTSAASSVWIRCRRQRFDAISGPTRELPSCARDAEAEESSALRAKARVRESD